MRKDRLIIPGLAVLGTATYMLLKRRSRPVPNHPFLAGKKPLVMAHRGGQGLWPPNTLFAFQKAVAMGVDVLELDIHMSKDGTLVVRHDDTVDRTTNGCGAIRALNLSEIKSLDAGYRWTNDSGITYPFRKIGITVPTLEEVFEAFPDIRINIDIKPEDPAIISPFADLLWRYRRTQNVMVGSFHDRQLAQFRAIYPEAATAAGVWETQLFFGLNLAHLSASYQGKANAFQIPESAGGLRLITERFIRAARTHNMEVHVWTVNSRQDMRRLLDWGATGIITDYPDRLLAELESTSSEVNIEKR